MTDTTAENPRAVMGDNAPPPPSPYDLEVFDKHQTKAREFADAAGAWLDLKTIETEEQATKLTDFVNGARGVSKEIDEARKTAKKPHDDAGKLVQKAYVPLIEMVDESGKKVSVMQADWIRRENARLEAIRIEEQKKAAAEKEQAERDLAAAEARNDIAGATEAAATLKTVTKEEKRAAKPVKASAGSATGGGRKMTLRKSYSARLTDVRLAFARYKGHPDVAEVFERLATQEIRAMTGEKAAPAGFELVEKEAAV